MRGFIALGIVGLIVLIGISIIIPFLFRYPCFFRSSSPIRIFSISFWIHRNSIVDIHNIPYLTMGFLV